MIPNPWLPLCGSPDREFLEHTFEEFQRTAEFYLESNTRPERSLPPMLVLACKDNEGRDGVGICVIKGPFSTKQERAEALKHSAKIMFDKGIYPGVVGMVNEAWHAVAKSGDTMAPSRRKDRGECLILYAETVAGENVGGMCKFTRDKANKPVLGKWEKNDKALRAPKDGVDMSQCCDLNDMPKEEVERFMEENFESPLKAFWEEYGLLAASAVGAN